MAHGTLDTLFPSVNPSPSTKRTAFEVDDETAVRIEDATHQFRLAALLAAPHASTRGNRFVPGGTCPTRGDVRARAARGARRWARPSRSSIGVGFVGGHSLGRSLSDAWVCGSNRSDRGLSSGSRLAIRSADRSALRRSGRCVRGFDASLGDQLVAMCLTFPLEERQIVLDEVTSCALHRACLLVE